MLWHADPEISYQMARDENELRIADHMRRSIARRTKRQHQVHQPGIVESILGAAGNLLISMGERLQRRSGNVQGRLGYQ